MMNRARILLGQLGSSARRRRSLNMLLPVSDLPGRGWRILGQGSWRMGIQNRRSDISLRCRKSGEFTALRRFRQEDPPRSLFVQVGTYASETDATEAVAFEPPSDRGNRWPGVTRFAEGEITDLGVPNVDDLHGWELHTQRGERRSCHRLIQGRVDMTVFAISGTAAEPGWAWEDLVPIASAQARRIRLVLAECESVTET